MILNDYNFYLFKMIPNISTLLGHFKVNTFWENLTNKLNNSNIGILKHLSMAFKSSLKSKILRMEIKHSPKILSSLSMPSLIELKRNLKRKLSIKLLQE